MAVCIGHVTRGGGGEGKAGRIRDGKIIISEWTGLEALRKAEDREE